MTQTTGYDTTLDANPLELQSAVTSSNSVDARPKGYALEVTERMRKRFAKKLDEYVLCVADLWREAGDDPTSEEGIRGLAIVRQAMTVPEREEWMHPLDAVATFTSIDDDNPSPEEHLEMRDAMRTAWGLGDAEYFKAVSAATGMTIPHLKAMYGTPTARRKQQIENLEAAPTAVYRHFDSAGVLLYVGMTADFKNRDSVHEFKSVWWGFVAETTTEWHDGRELARVAEREAIKAEQPVFNTIHTNDIWCEKRHADYLASHELP